MSLQHVMAIRSERVICVVKSKARRSKAFQVFFGRDGSLFINFPYFRHRTGLLSSSIIPGNGAETTQMNPELGGKVTSHLVKYSHHPDGRAHFSQDGKIFTAIRRQSIALENQHGCLFSLLIQGGETALDIANPTKDAGNSRKRAVVDFEIEQPEAIKFIGRWYDINKLPVINPAVIVGPIMPVIAPDGTSGQGFFVASPYEKAKHVLLLTCQPIPKIGSEPERFVFCGGFDPVETMTDPTKDAGFLLFLYPVAPVEKILQRVGTVDLNLKPTASPSPK